MGRKRIYHTVRIESIERKIALWELTGQDDLAHGLRLFFSGVFDEANIEDAKQSFVNSSPDLAGSYTPKEIAPQPARHKGRAKTGTFREIRTVRNRPGGQSYRWAYDVTYQDGKRIKSKSIGRVK